MDLGISGKRAAVAAASDGLGFATAAALAAEGVSVAICGRDKDRLDDAVKRLGDPAVGLNVDVSTADGGTDFVNQAREALGGIDILVANGGGPPEGNFATMPLSDYIMGFELNCLSSIAMCYAAVPQMQEAGWGRVLAITSIAVKQPRPDLILSNVARTGLTGFIKTVAREIAGSGVTLNSILPGPHNTKRARRLGASDDQIQALLDAGTMGTPENFGEIAAFMCSEPARFMTGVALQVDGGIFAGTF